jgi:alkanesulfonate monooxygenase SsuD/methylene tetrahydromethanopterin reductase-like flavin-dependent oxidoreductase (luciferase family)
MRMPLETIVDRALAAESAGFTGIALMDHLSPPMAESQPMYDAIVTATWLAAATSTLTLSHLVLCDAFRHPAVLARQAVTLDHASGGRFELGIGWGSVPEEFDTYGVGETAPRVRVARLAETLEVLRRLWTGDPVDFDGEFHQIRGGQQQPPPLGRIPVVIGGAGPKTLRLVAEYADWWNCPVYAQDRFEGLREETGAARSSLQTMLAFVPSGGDRSGIEASASRRFGAMGFQLGDGPELREHFAGLATRGAERIYVWFTDFAAPETLEAFGREVIAPLR